MDKMTNEEAIECLVRIDESIQPNSRWWRWGFKKALKIAIEAVKKQIPKKPFCDEHTVIQYCPNCKRQLRTFISVESQRFHGYERETLHANNCENCGQAIDWSED